MEGMNTVATDPIVISAVLGGQTDRFQELILRHQKMVYGIAWSQLGTVNLAEEAAQQTFVKAFSRLSTLRDPGKFQGWLATIARNVSVSIGKSRRRELSNSVRWDIEPIAKSDEASAERANLTEELRTTLAGLPDIHRQVLTLFYLEEQSIKAVALSLDLTEATVKTRLNRARKLLRQELDRRLGETLSELGPSRCLSIPVMAALSSASQIGGVVKIGLIGNAMAVAGKSFGLFLSPLTGLFVGMLPSWFLSKRIAKQDADRFQDSKEHDFRREITMKNPVYWLVLLAGAGVASIQLSRGLGPHTTFFMIAIFCLWGLWKGVRHLRVQDTGLARASIGCLVLWFVVSLAMGICILTNAFSKSTFVMAPIALAMIAHVSIMYRFRLDIPVRADYNLFLRAASGGLLANDDDSHDPTSQLPASEMDSLCLESFAKFLGQHWLISDYELSTNQIRLDLPAVETNLTRLFLGSKKSTSSITINRHGQCGLYYSPCDEAAIGKLPNLKTDAVHVTSVLKRAIESCLREFSKGDRQLALRTLNGLEDAEIFKPDAKQSFAARQKRLFWMSISISIFLIMLWPTTNLIIHFFGLR